LLYQRAGSVRKRDLLPPACNAASAQAEFVAAQLGLNDFRGGRGFPPAYAEIQQQLDT
jgi:hypothetical protein